MLRGIWTLIVALFATFALATPVALLCMVVPGWGDTAIRAGRLWSRMILAAAGARVDYSGLEHMTAQSPCVYISNHQSMADVLGLLRVVPLQTRFVAKRELFRIPIFGWALAASGFVPIDRGNRSDAIRSLRLAGERIRGGCSVVLFPEGTRSRDGRLQPFKKGAFHLALAARVPVVPVAISGSFEVMPPGTLAVRPGGVRVVFLEPLEITTYLPDDHEGLRGTVHRRIAEQLGARPCTGAAGAIQFETS